MDSCEGVREVSFARRVKSDVAVVGGVVVVVVVVVVAVGVNSIWTRLAVAV